MTYAGDVTRVHVAVGHEVIHATMEAPSPCRDGAAVGRIVLRGIVARKPGVNSIADFLAVGIHVAAAKCRQRVAAFDNPTQRPVHDLAAARGFRGGIVRATLAGVVKPAACERHARIIGERVVAAEVHDQEHRH